MKRSDFHFDLPPELIAQHPAERREDARLLAIDAAAKRWEHRHIRDLPALVPERSLIVPNDVRVRHARLFLRRSGGGKGEALLLKSLGRGRFEAMVRPGARLRPGAVADVVDPRSGEMLARLEVLETLPEGLREVRVSTYRAAPQAALPVTTAPGGGASSDHGLDWDEIDRIGRLPLPPYITHLASEEDEFRYQTVFAAREGEAVAAPTAGLHFTPDLIESLEARGCLWRPVRLHVGLGTFRPMEAEDLADHVMHEERFEIPQDTRAALETVMARRDRPMLAVGTTALRALESAWTGAGFTSGGSTRLFITPGYRLCTADHLLTNFHLPESTLFILVSALMGLDLAQAAYAEAIQERYRFFSYGDAMLILNVRR